MIGKLFTKIFGTRHDREIRRLQPVIEHINSLGEEYDALSQAELQERVSKWKNAVMDGEEELDDLLPDAFAAVRTAAERALKQRHYDVQLIGGIALHKGKIAEMRTGEGKTLSATAPAFLNALTGRGVHIVTVNDYLAKRDAEWMGQVYRYLGLTTGYIVTDLDNEQRRKSYLADVTYGTNNEFGFDYLRDNMVPSLENCVQRGHYYAMVDEVDSILIDEARTPLIISGPSEKTSDDYYKVAKIIPKLKEGDHYDKEEKHKTVFLTEDGMDRVESLLKVTNLYDPQNIEYLHMVENGLRAHVMFHKDVDYIVSDQQEIIIVDENTGRLMPGRRYSDGLHQALEAKEGVPVAGQNQTLATITLQNYFRMYDKLSGMTGTAETEVNEFMEIYKLDVLVIPTHKPLIRDDRNDVIYKTRKEKFEAACDEILDARDKGQPCLVGTISIENSEIVAGVLERRGLKRGVDFNVLNAKYHEKEAEIVAQAGQKGAITIATNMAGRGTDIVLGEGVPEAGGLYIIGTERHESRRIDNQLRGRAGRQGDPGASRFFLSMEDNLLRIFGGDRIRSLMEWAGVEEGEPIEHRSLNRTIENAQKKVEAQNFSARKNLLKYDDVMNKQREVIYDQRRSILTSFLAPQEVYAQLAPLLPEAPASAEEEKPLEWNWRRMEFFVDDVLNLEWEAPETDEERQAFDRKKLCDEISEALYEEIGRPMFEDEIVSEAVDDLVDEIIAGVHPDEWDGEELAKSVAKTFGFQWRISKEELESFSEEELVDNIFDAVWKRFEEREEEFGRDFWKWFLRFSLIKVIDQQWKDHLLMMDHLKEGIGLRGYGQKDPLIEYKKEGYRFFMDLMQRLNEDAAKAVFLTQIQKQGDPNEYIERERAQEEHEMQNVSYSGPAKESEEKDAKPKTVRKDKKLKRNEPCWCGSGKKYKHCHYKADMEQQKQLAQK